MTHGSFSPGEASTGRVEAEVGTSLKAMIEG
jgi:hypothetical protein